MSGMFGSTFPLFGDTSDNIKGLLIHCPDVANSKQVWEVQLRKTDPSNSKKKSLVSSSRVTLVCNMPVPEHLKEAGETLKKYAKL